MTSRSRSVEALATYAREPGRSASLTIETAHDTWIGGVAEDTLRPAVSVMKLALAIAVDDTMQTGDLPDVSVRELLTDAEGPSILHALNPDRCLAADEVLRLCLSASDNPSATWLLNLVGLEEVRRALRAAGCTMGQPAVGADGLLSGELTSRESLLLLRAALTRPRAAAGLRQSILNSRIPLGVDAGDIAHKTGTLVGVAHDVARITCDGGTVWIAFLTDHQHDTLVTGYDMGLCTRSVLDAWGLNVRSTLGTA